MTGICNTRGSADYEAGRCHSETWLNFYKRDGSKRGIVFCPGGGSDELWYRTVTALPAGEALPIALATGGFPVVSFEGEFTWGNSTAMTRVTDLRTYAQSSLGFAAGKVHLLGVSMGATIALNWAKANPTLVASIGLVIPCVDIQDVYDNNRGGYASSVSTAWSGRPSDANTPAMNAASFTGFPIKIWYSTTDPICVASTITPFGAAVGAKVVSLGAQGHGATNLDVNDVFGFFNAIENPLNIGALHSAGHGQ